MCKANSENCCNAYETDADDQATPGRLTEIKPQDSPRC